MSRPPHKDRYPYSHGFTSVLRIGLDGLPDKQTKRDNSSTARAKTSGEFHYLPIWFRLCDTTSSASPWGSRVGCSSPARAKPGSLSPRYSRTRCPWASCMAPYIEPARQHSYPGRSRGRRTTAGLRRLRRRARGCRTSTGPGCSARRSGGLRRKISLQIPHGQP
jgi:hypothetical protein